MKQKIFTMICMILCVVCCTFGAKAAKEDLSVQFYDIGSAKYVTKNVTTVDLVYNGQVLAPDVPALIDRGRTLVPIYIIGGLLDADVSWNQEFRRAVINTQEKQLILSIGSSVARVNGQQVDLPDAIPAALVKYQGSDRTMVPWRFVAEQLGARVEWDAETYTVTLFFDETQVLHEPKPELPTEEGSAEEEPEEPEEEETPPKIFTSLEDVIVVLDAGHGGDDPGALGEDVQEKDINLAVTLLVYQKLSETGVQVHLTRSDDTYVSLLERTLFANSIPADIFVSMHSNAAEDAPSANGIETYYYSDDSPGADLAAYIQDEVVNATGAKNRKTKTANFYVCKNTVMPAALVEMGFLTNIQECQLLATEEYQAALAEGIANGILAYAESLIQ